MKPHKVMFRIRLRIAVANAIQDVTRIRKMLGEPFVADQWLSDLVYKELDRVRAAARERGVDPDAIVKTEKKPGDRHQKWTPSNKFGPPVD